MWLKNKETEQVQLECASARVRPSKVISLSALHGEALARDLPETRQNREMTR